MTKMGGLNGHLIINVLDGSVLRQWRWHWLSVKTG